ncbi:MAG: hypothetical protein ABII90_02905 [Bacteroidota bacterium]
MIQPKKFGTFAGVFTPSILTILGVIMYMRMGWVVGESGLTGALIIIMIAHVISVSTGLSISSIATDKKIKTGGIYYMLSRSLGLPMGGAIGITIFVGTALSISLYVVGFCENFIGIDPIREFLGLSASINDFRIVGTVVIILLVILAFISTSLAIKTQFIILAAIALSLISIFIGFFLNTEFVPVNVAIQPVKDALPLEVVFAIFFPAVTGFTAGVAMSGDLKDPKKAIPTGTMAAIGIGLLIYTGLAIGFAYFVNRDLLINDNNFLMKIAWSSPLLIAGIWGATLSSALGGILGGPRILQAISKDKITPKLLAKGYGQNNEPRNALIFTFLIAEAGILIGDLNIIARVVSMFYLAAYGFINLAYALEKWASSDFRPSFNISKFIGIIGFFACFAVMFKLDTLAMIAAFMIICGIYLYLRKKELQLDFGDVWQSVWSSIIRTTLHEMDRKEMEERNWRPNIILFSGGTNVRPYLIEFGKYLVGKLGFLSNFDLIENKSANVLFPKHKQSISRETESFKGVFTRKLSCRDIYEGIEMIARTYGFAGIEPNTAFLGWLRQSKEPERFIKMIKTITDLDLNLMIMNYNNEKGFGKKKLVDIWWNGASNNCNLALSLMKFIWLSDDWREAKVRLLIVNPVNDESDKIHKDTNRILENLRVDAEVRVINNQIEQKPLYEIIRVESINTDLTFLGIPEIQQGREKESVDNANKLIQNIGTVILIKASSYFKELQIGVKQKLIAKKEQLPDGIDLIIKAKMTIPEISLPEKEITANQVKSLSGNITMLVENYYQNHISGIIQLNNDLTHSIRQLADKSFANIEKIAFREDTVNQWKLISDIQTNFLVRSRKIIEEFHGEILEIQKDKLLQAITNFLNDLDDKIKSTPKQVIVHYDLNDLKPEKNDNISIRRSKFYKRLKIKITPGKSSVKYIIHYKRLISSYLPVEVPRSLNEILDDWGLFNLQYIIELQRSLNSVRNSFLLIGNQSFKGDLSSQMVAEEKQKAGHLIDQLGQLNRESLQSLHSLFLQKTTGIVQKISDDLKHPDVNSLIKKDRKAARVLEQLKKKLTGIPPLWLINQHLLYNAALAELRLLSFRNLLRTIFSNITIETERMVETTVLKNLSGLDGYISKYLEELRKGHPAKFNPQKAGIRFDQDDFQPFFGGIIDATFKKIKSAISKFPETVDIMDEGSFDNFEFIQYDEPGIEMINIFISRLLDYLIQDELIEPLQKIFGELPGELQKSNITGRNVVNMISYSIDQTNADVVANAGFVSFIKEEQLKIINQFNKTVDIKTQTVLQINERLNSVSERLSLYTFTKITRNLTQYIKKQETKKAFSFMRNNLLKIRSFAIDQIDQLWYRQSKALLLAKSLTPAESRRQTGVNDLLNLLDDVSINEDVINKLPFYYQQLFLSKHHYHNEFWVGREKGLAGIKKSIDRYKTGFTGGIIIVGEQNSGRTFFSQYISSRYFDNPDIYTVNPVYQGSVDPEVFKETLQKSLNLYGSYEEIFNGIPKNSIVIIDDLELWWEKSPGGFKVIDIITGLIEQFNNKCLFIINSNIHSFNFMTRIRKFENFILNIVECESFNAEQLKDIILFRHQSGGIKFMLNDKIQDRFRSLDHARLFSRYFNYSKGNVGVALQAWMANITGFDNNIISMKPPKTPDLSVLDYLETGWLVIILEFILHKRLSFERLKRITLQDAESLQNTINNLKRLGIIAESSRQADVLELNRFLYAHLKNKLVEMEML